MTVPYGGVLLVDDNADSRTVYRLILEHFGYQVHLAVNGEEAIRRALEHQPGIILMDISIPLIDGWEATRILKADPATAHIPVVALTAHALSSDREKGRELGFDGYLVKPVEPRRVLDEVRRWLPLPHRPG
jgi:CheY-like chemotaxis protein